MSEQKTIAKMTGYKATDRNMRCKGYKFRLGKWSKTITGELVECNNGYHFCENMSGVWSYYPLPCAGTRVFKVEAEDVLVTDPEPGADVKRVCRRLRLVEEVTGFDGRGNTGKANTGSGNTGSYNTGHRNTGDGNTGSRNTGQRNIGGCNTGDGNTGSYNTGSYNTGYCNTGSCNTGSDNTGDRNTGRRNTGERNSGDRNIGNGNTGDDNAGDYNTGDLNIGSCNTGSGNACSNSSGFFCDEDPEPMCFNKPAGMSRTEFENNFLDLVQQLCLALPNPNPPDFETFKALPNITPEALERLHRKHHTLRKASKGGNDETH